MHESSGMGSVGCGQDSGTGLQALLRTPKVDVERDQVLSVTENDPQTSRKLTPLLT